MSQLSIELPIESNEDLGYPLSESQSEEKFPSSSDSGFYQLSPSSASSIFPFPSKENFNNHLYKSLFYNKDYSPRPTKKPPLHPNSTILLEERKNSDDESDDCNCCTIC